MTMNAYVLERDYGFAPGHSVSEEDATSYVALLWAIARADGVSTEEATFIGVAQQALGVSESAATEAVRRSAADSIEALVAAVDDAPTRACVYRDVYRLALADGVITAEETACLNKAAAALGVSGVLKASLEQWVRDDIALQDRLGRLLFAVSEQ